MHATLRDSWCRLEREKLRIWQGHRLHAFLKHAVVPFSAHYARVFAENGLTADDFRSIGDLEKLPFTSKADLLPTPENPKHILDFVLRPSPAVIRRRPSTIASALMRGPSAARAAVEREWRPVFMTSTTGRSAEPVPFLYTQYDLANLGLGGGRIVELGKCAPDERLLNLFPYAPHLGYWLVHHACLDRNLFQVGTGGGRCMGTVGNVRMIERLQPQLLVGMPTFLYHVLHEALEGGKRFTSIRLLVLGGEKVPAGMRRKLSELCAALGSPAAQAVSTYGFTEAKMAWTECPVAPGVEPTGYHLYPDLGIFEVIDPETNMPVPEGCPGEIVYTPLDARGTVVLRYRTGDRIEGGLVHTACPACGRIMPRLVGRISRVSEIRTLKLEKIKGTLVDFNAVEHMLDDVPGIGAWQVELRKRHDDPLEVDEIILHLSADAGASHATVAERITAELVAAFEIRPNAIEFHSGDEIRRLHKVGEALKEERFVDNRPAAAAKPHVPIAPAQGIRRTTGSPVATISGPRQP